MVCIKCGNQLNEGAKFCKACGQNQTEQVIPKSTGAQTETKASSNKTKGKFKMTKKSMIIAGAVVALLIAIPVGASVLKSDKVVVGKAILSTVHEATGEAADLIDQLPILGFFTEMEKEKYLIDITADVGYMDMNLSLMSDYKDGKLKMQGEESSTGGEFSMQISDDFITGTLSLLGDDTYGISNETLVADLENCSFMDAPDMPEDYHWDLFNANTEVYDTINKVGLSTLTSLVDVLEVEKLEKEDLRINGKNITVDAYSVAITQEDLEEQLTLSVEKVFQDEAIREYFDVYFQSYGSVNGYDSMDSDDIHDMALDAVDEIVNSYEDLEDYDFKVYIHNNRVARFCVENDGTKAYVDLNSQGKILENVAFVFENEEEDWKDEMILSMVLEDEKFDGELKLKSSGSSSESVTVEYDMKETKDNLVLTWPYGDEFALDVDSQTKNELSIGYSDESVDISAYCVKGKLESGWFDQSDDFTNILTMDEADIMAIAYGMYAPMSP